MEQLKAYKFRIYPTEEQEIFFAKTFGCVRKVYNLMLDERMKNYEESKLDVSKKQKFPTPAKYNINVNTNMYISACIKMYIFTHFLYLNNLLFGKSLQQSELLLRDVKYDPISH